MPINLFMVHLLHFQQINSIQTVYSHVSETNPENEKLVFWMPMFTMLSPPITAIAAGFLIPWLIETFIAACFLFFVIAVLLSDPVIRNTCLQELLPAIISAYYSTIRSCEMPPLWLRTCYRWARVKSQEYVPSLQLYEGLLHWLEKFYQGIQATLLALQGQNEVFLTKTSLCISQNINKIKAWVSDWVISICLWALKKQTWGAHHAVEDVRDTLSLLPLNGEYRLQLPTTEIPGVLDAATIHKAYHVLIASSLTFRQLTSAMRSAVLSKIVQEILNYDSAPGCIWSTKNPFTLAAQIIQCQLNADWFEKSIHFQLADAEIKCEGNASDTTATFIFLVFLIHCGFPTSTGARPGATNPADESVNMIREATASEASPVMTSSMPTSQRIRTSVLPGHSRQWHAVTRE